MVSLFLTLYDYLENKILSFYGFEPYAQLIAMVGEINIRGFFNKLSNFIYTI